MKMPIKKLLWLISSLTLTEQAGSRDATQFFFIFFLQKQPVLQNVQVVVEVTMITSSRWKSTVPEEVEPDAWWEEEKSAVAVVVVVAEDDDDAGGTLQKNGDIFSSTGALVT